MSSQKSFWDFEEISKEFQKLYRGSTIAHGDRLEVELEGGEVKRVAVVEVTSYTAKNLLDRNIFQNELRELVKKMWGSYGVLVWYLVPSLHSKPRQFVIEVVVDPRYSRIISKLRQELERFRGGSFREIRFILKQPS
jgi:hypothetical protein